MPERTSVRAQFRRRAIAALVTSVVAAPVLLATAAPADARPATSAQQHGKAERLAKKLVKASSGKSAYRHLEAFQEIADDNGGNRAAGTPGHKASTEYVYRLLKKAGYDVSYQNFDFYESTTQREKLAVVSPEPRDVKVTAYSFSKSSPAGGLVAPLAAARVDGTPGCELDDYASGDFKGKIALVKRGNCTFQQKEEVAAKAGAIGLILYNHSGTEPVHGTVGDPANAHIPAGGISLADGEALAAQIAKGETKVNLDVSTEAIKRQTRNVIAETRGGSADHVVALGSHLDSVPAGPGINDNGSGSAGLLEVALKLAAETRGHGQQPTNKVRFAWWSGEELGLLGSEHYVKQLSEKQRKQTALYLNFDMIASPNPVEFVYDGDDSDHKGEGPGPQGSAQIERLINGYLDGRRSPHEGTDFDGRSDYGPFIKAGIPAGGTFTGAEGIKTKEQAARFGGTAGTAYDPNYHGAGDTLENLDLKVFDTNVDVIAHAVGIYAHDLSSLNEPVKG
ncbi:M28 family metallopeptidase [Streptomyces sp. SCA3-4]|uniref:M28 family metallopeptidase n=1 Tax=Streptomyces sichuanensis TaxID=2871810 RepID=UPI001CE2CBEC|nr:M28 family metallopeptidase [Streptomyces sichuanensis]MCA6095988.1 M28 family metallopeptidase [Streptomyces sichuanensis]